MTQLQFDMRFGADDAHGLGGCEGQDGQGEGTRHPFALERIVKNWVIEAEAVATVDVPWHHVPIGPRLACALAPR